MTETSGSLRPARFNAIYLVIAWLVVALPTGWGVYQSGKRASLLFHPTPAQATTRAVR